MRIPSNTKGHSWLRLGRDSSLYLIGNILSRAAGFVLLPVYTRYLNPSEYGTIELIELTTQIASLLLGAGLFANAMIRIAQDYNTERERNSVISTAMYATFAISLLVLSTLWLGAPAIGNSFFHSSTASPLLRYAGLAAVFSMITECGLTVERLRGRALYFVGFSLVSVVSTIILNVVFIAGLRLGVLGFIASKMVVTTITAAVLLVRGARDYGWAWNPDAARRMLRFGAPLILANLAFFLVHFGDRFFLGRFTTLAEVGVYSLGYRFGFLVTFLVGEPFGRAWGVDVYKHVGQDGWTRNVARLAKYLCIALAAVSLALSILGKDLIHVMAAPGYERAATVIPIVVTAYAIREMGDFFRNLLYVKKESAAVATAATVSAILNVFLSLLWIPRFGIMGAAWATLATWGVYTLLICWATLRKFDFGFGLPSCIGVSALALLVYAPYLALGMALPVERIGWVIAAMVIYAMLLWRSGLISSQEKLIFAELTVELRKRVRRTISPWA
jgi:O-antigen/teichoic acid export membrane protein